MAGTQDQFAELTRRTQENFRHLWEQWSQRSNELLKGMSGRAHPMTEAPGNPEEVLDAVFDFAENLIAQQRAFAKQMLRAASRGQQTIADVASSADVPVSTQPTSTTTTSTASAASPTSPSAATSEGSGV
jgi:hypothetical protein